VLLGIITATLMIGAGFAGLRLVGVSRGPSALGLAPAAGIGLLAVLTTWALRLQVPEPIVGLMILGLGVTGAALGASELAAGSERWRCHRLELGALSVALITTLVVLGQSVSVQAGVPDYVHDGAFHTEMIDALRRGSPLPGYGWYPSGFHAPAAALLSLVPAVDSASGAVGWAVGLTLLAPLAMFGFTRALWTDTRVAAASALVLALTYNFPYEPHLYSVWPSAAGFLLLLGLGTVAFEYLARPSPRLAILGGLLACGLLLTHGTELYSAAIVLLVIAGARWRTVASPRVAWHVGVAAAAAVVFAAPYVPALAGWAAGGGAVAVGTEYFDVRHGGFALDDPLQEALFWASAFGSGLLFDAPVRLGLLLGGAWLAFRRQHGALLVALASLFVALVAMFRYLDTPLVRQVFALTLPWGVDGRLLMTVPLLATPLSALGLVRTGEVIVEASRGATTDKAKTDKQTAAEAAADMSTADMSTRDWSTADKLSVKIGHHRGRRRVARMALLLGVAFAPLSVFLVAQKFVLQTNGIVTYTPDDAAAFAWLRAHAQRGDVLMNDGAADAGIWAAYKTGVSIVLPRSKAVDPRGPESLVRANLSELDTRPEVRQAACRLGIRYVYRGASNSPSEHRHFPSLETLRASAALEELFSSGDAAIFRPRQNCS